MYLQLTRTSMQLIKELERFTPPPVPELDEHPDMITAAAQAREKILERVRRRASKEP